MSRLKIIHVNNVQFSSVYKQIVTLEKSIQQMMVKRYEKCVFYTEGTQPEKLKYSRMIDLYTNSVLFHKHETDTDDDADNNIPHVLTKSVDVLRYNVLALKMFAPDTIVLLNHCGTLISCKSNSQSAYLDMKKCAVYFIVK